MLSNMKNLGVLVMFLSAAAMGAADDFPKPYDTQCTEREDVFAFTRKPSVKLVGKDRYEIAFEVKGNCDVTVAIVDPEKELIEGRGTVVRHLASGVLGKNAPPPFRRNTLSQNIYWDGKDDLEAYVREPDKLKVRVSLGFQPRYDKRLGGSSPYNSPGYVCGIAVGPEGAMVFSHTRRTRVRRYDHDGNYVMTILPPPANLQKEKLAGMGYVEYEPGRYAVHGPKAHETVAGLGHIFDLGGDDWGNVQPAAHDGRVYFLNSPVADGAPAPLYYLRMDGTTEVRGVQGVVFGVFPVSFPRLAASPDGKWLYMTGAGGGRQYGMGTGHVVMRQSLTGETVAQPFLGKFRLKKNGTFASEPGNDDRSFNNPAGIACDAEGRIYVCDYSNNRVQVFSSEGKPLKTIPADRPMLVHVHQKTGAIYLLHMGRVRGKSVGRVTKFASWGDPKVEFHQDGITAGVFGLDSWSARPRLWMAGGETHGSTRGRGSSGDMAPVVIYEEDKGALRKIADFDERAKREDGPFYYGRWRDVKGGGSGGGDKIVCDPVREKAYIHCRQVYDLRSGHYLGEFKPATHRVIYEDLGIDKKGYMHVHFNPGFYAQGVARVDPSQAKPYDPRGRGTNTKYYPEVPYDYGVPMDRSKGKGWLGILPVKDQPGAKFFQDGLGVNMRGDVAVESNIFYVPKMDETAMMSILNAGAAARDGNVHAAAASGFSYEGFLKDIADREKRGEHVYSLRRKPGIDLAGGTIWTFDRTGELRKECAVTAGALINGAQIDNGLSVYFVTWRPRAVSPPAGAFLAGRGGTFGVPDGRKNRNPHTGTFVKTKPDAYCTIVSDRSRIPLDPLPARAPDLVKGKTKFWVEGHEWLYAGASPIVSGGCSCQTMRPCVDWYRRSLVPEAYRHSIGVVDPNGNLIMHIGRYGNFDSGDGPKSRIPIGGDNISTFQPRMVSATDNYMVFDSWCERYTVLRIAYHAEETVEIGGR